MAPIINCWGKNPADIGQVPYSSSDAADAGGRRQAAELNMGTVAVSFCAHLFGEPSQECRILVPVAPLAPPKFRVRNP